MGRAGERLDKIANREYSNAHRVTERLRFPTEPSRINSRRHIVPWIVEHLDDGDRVIDIAGGVGTYASLIARERPVTIIGVDISEHVVAARGQDPLLRENVVADMEALPFESESFDAAMFVAALHHVPDPLPALREAWRVLRPGGHLFAFEPSSLRARGGSRPIPGSPHEFRMSRSWLLRRVCEAGFALEEIRGLRISMQFFGRVAGTSSARVWRVADSVDAVLMRVPLVDRIGQVVRLRALRPPSAERGVIGSR